MLGARRELGPELEPEVIDAFADRVERAIDARVDARLGQRGGGAERPRTDRSSLVLALGSLGVGIPITGIGTEEPIVAIVGWIGIMAVNFAHAIRR